MDEFLGKEYSSWGYLKEISEEKDDEVIEE
jgi:hypothetical protein